MANNIYVINEDNVEDTQIIGYHTNYNEAKKYLERINGLFKNDSSQYYLVGVEHLEDIDYLNGRFEDCYIDDDWDDYDEKWDEYSTLYSCDFEPIKKHRGKLRDD